MQKHFEGKICNYTFGVNDVNGVFIKIYNRATSVNLHFYEFIPGSLTFLTEEIGSALRNNVIDKEEFEIILNYPLGHYHVYFENIDTLNAGEYWSEYLEAYVKEGNPPIEVKNLKQYFNFVSAFAESDYIYGNVTWLKLFPIEFIFQLNTLHLKD
ncbi:hypothetical protein [Solibacillus sp. FSL K6-1554]|uniref:hypothetical protein n=1 Tax=Solibacillus sp. FSL K6-1554 TaxID=2921472 RepID=UPI0030F7E5FB